MARRGGSVDETIECGGIGAGEATDRLLAVVAAEYRAVNVGASRFQFARTYRPTWTIVCAVLLFPIGLLFLLVRSTETWAATIEEDHRRVRVRLTGPILPHVLVGARTALAAGPNVHAGPAPAGVVAEPVATPGSAVGSSPGIVAQPVAVPAQPIPAPPVPVVPIPVSPSPGPPAPLPVPGPFWQQPSPTPAWVPTVPPDPSQVTLSPPPAPVPAPPPAPVAPPPRAERGEVTQVAPVDRDVVPGFVLAFDTGERVPVADLLLIGRDPEGAGADAHAVLVPVADPELSVSKTHLSAGGSGGSFWVCDRGSTNGTTVEAADGTTTALRPGERVAVEPGVVVRFGKRRFVVTNSSGGA